MSASEYIYGFHAVNAVLGAQPELVREIFLLASKSDQRTLDILNLSEKHQVTVTKISRAEIEKNLPKGAVHQGVVAVCRAFSGLKETVLQEVVEHHCGPILLLVLDGVQDPHNLGACLRSANAFGAAAVIAPKDRACGLTSVARKVACGAAGLTPFIQVTNLSRTLQWLQKEGVWLVGLDVETDAVLSDIDLTGSIALVMGSEGSGMRKLTRKNCDYVAKIPMRGNVQSVNVSAASAVSLYEAVRQRSVE